jgi:SAM-dependent methyltransferase
MSQAGVPSSDLTAEEKAQRSGSFGSVAADYERYRPGPPIVAVDWMLPNNVDGVIDLGAGTGALTRLLVGRAQHVMAVEPDGRMRAVLIEQVPDARAIEGRGDAMPLPDNCADAVLASSSWHWMDVVPTLREIARVLRPGGTLGAVWTGPDPEGPFMEQARQLLGAGPNSNTELGAAMGEEDRPFAGLVIPDGSDFGEPEYEAFRWEVPLTADDLVGLLGTFSWIIMMDDERRERVYGEVRRLLREVLGVEGDVTVDVTWRADTYRTRCTA